MIPEAGCVDVVISHGPPMGILDQPYGTGEHVGCYDLLERVKNSVPLVQVFGHIHGSYGQKKIGSTTYINASICTEDYKPVNAPIVLDI
jgi:Icc-related predicted phosphoesterase